MFVVSALMVILLIGVLSNAWQYTLRSPGIDFYQFWIVPQVVKKHNGIDIYTKQEKARIGEDFYQESLKSHISQKRRLASRLKREIEITGSPFFFTIMSGFNLINYDFDIKVFYSICIFSFIATVVYISWSLRHPYLFTIGALILSIGWFDPYWSDLRVANVNQIQLGMLTLFLWFQKNSCKWKYGDFFSGAVLGLSLMFKPNVVFIIILLGVWWIRNQKHRKLTHVFSGIATGSAFAFIVSSMFFGTPACWIGWLKGVRYLITDYYLPINIGNTSLPMIIEERYGYHISGQIANFLTAGILLSSIVVVWMAPRGDEKNTPMEGSSQALSDIEFRETVLLVGLGLTIFLLSSRLVWMHYRLLILPLALYLLGTDKKKFISAVWANMIYKLLAVVAVLAIATIPIEPLYSFTSHMQRAFIAYLGMMTLFVMGLLDLFCIKSRSVLDSG